MKKETGKQIQFQFKNMQNSAFMMETYLKKESRLRKKRIKDKKRNKHKSRHLVSIVLREVCELSIQIFII